jgi:predicted TPR repeat methyltransferase
VIESEKEKARACIMGGQFTQAKALYAEICRVQPNEPESWFMLGALNGHLGLTIEAINCCLKAIALKPSYAEAHYNLAQAYKRLEKPAEAEASFREAVKYKPDYAEALDNLGYLLQERGKTEEAIACYRAVLRLRPDFTGTRYLLAALEGGKVPERAPPDYVRGLFDNYADRFDKHLTEVLECRIPQQLNQAIRRVIAPRPAGLDVMDLGCGTGLCGTLLRDIARSLIGVDLSPGMVAKARDKKIYDELHVQDIMEALRKPGRSFDLIIAADVFVYVGDLASVFQSCRTSLKAGGIFAFSVESEEQDINYVLRQTDRYAHSAKYIRSLAGENGFQELSLDKVILRKHKDVPVEGYIFVLHRQD